jgi:hypothetical protein
VRGINSNWKWNPVKNQINDAFCDIVCLQETKKETVDASFLRKICPYAIDSFEFLPYVGASRGILVAWKSMIFEGEKIFSNDFAMSIQFCSKHDNSS